MHVSLDSALGRQRRLNSVGESVLQIAPNAAAAYSLRSLTGGDPRVVRVRRASDNHEQDFTASGVSSGALTSFVNAQVVAPLDIQALSATGRDGDFLIAKAAYSLRSLGTRQATLAATGDTVARADGKYVVQVRRNSDDTLKSFTADEVTDGTLLAFVNEIQTVGTAVNGTGSFDNYTVSNLSNTGFSADNSAGGTGSAGFPYVFKDEDVIVVKYTVTNFSSTASLSPQIRGVSAINSVTGKTNSGTAFTANGTYTDTLTATADGTHLMFADGNTGSYTISDFEIVSHSSNGFVKTWYDQSVTNQAGDTATGNHAVQATAASQPKIVNAGSLVTDGGLLFNGDTNFFDIGSSISLGTEFLFTGVLNRNSAVDSNGTIIGNDSNGGGNRAFINTLTNAIALRDGDANIQSSLVTSDSSDSLISYQASASSFTFILNGTTDVESALTGGQSFRYIGGGSGFNLSANLKELIVYDTDQSDNRTAIEANIGEAYSIDLPSGVDPGFDQVDGFVETWYDQSGNGKDAVQETAANQPLIVSAGVVLTGLDFDGSTSSRTLVAPSVTGLAGSLSIFSVSVRDATGNTVSLSNSSSGGRYFAIQEGGSTSVANPRNITSITVSDSVSVANRLTFAVTTGATSTSVGANSSAVTTTTDDYGDDFSGTHINQIAIGVLRTASPTGYFNGRINEILVYNSDQTDNRSAVETNINSHYSLF